MKDRNLSIKINNLSLGRKKIALVSGPRQCGKTTLAKSLLLNDELYFSWDDQKFKTLWVKSPERLAELALATPRPRIVLDEIHKNRRWKNQVKSFYDYHGKEIEIILAGSARLSGHREKQTAFHG